MTSMTRNFGVWPWKNGGKCGWSQQELRFFLRLSHPRKLLRFLSMENVDLTWFDWWNQLFSVVLKEEIYPETGINGIIRNTTRGSGGMQQQGSNWAPKQSHTSTKRWLQCRAPGPPKFHLSGLWMSMVRFWILLRPSVRTWVDELLIHNDGWASTCCPQVSLICPLLEWKDMEAKNLSGSNGSGGVLWVQGLTSESSGMFHKRSTHRKQKNSSKMWCQMPCQAAGIPCPGRWEALQKEAPGFWDGLPTKTNAEGIPKGARMLGSKAGKTDFWLLISRRIHEKTSRDFWCRWIPRYAQPNQTRHIQTRSQLLQAPYS